MSTKEILNELRKLDYADKVRVLEGLTRELASQQRPKLDRANYEIWSPFDAAGASETLLRLLEEEDTAKHE